MSIQANSTATPSLKQSKHVAEYRQQVILGELADAWAAQQELKVRISKTELQYSEAQQGRQTQLNQLRSRHQDTGSLLGQMELARREQDEADAQFENELLASKAEIDRLLDSYNELM